MLKCIFTILFCCSQLGILYAQESPAVPTEEIVVEAYDDLLAEDEDEEKELFIDTILSIRPIRISDDSVRIWKRQPDFKYLANLDSLLDAEQHKKETAKEPRFNVGSPDTSLLKGLMWLLAIAFVLFVTYQLFQNKGLFKGGSRKLAVSEVVPEAEEDILELNIHQMLMKAEQQANFRLATRYQFIKTLQLLNQKNRIDFAVDKTNRQYQYEIPEQWRTDFSKLVLNYEYIWFGNVHIDQPLYEKITTLHTSFNARL